MKTFLLISILLSQATTNLYGQQDTSLVSGFEVELADDSKNHVKIEKEKIPNVCGGSYITDFLVNKHPDRSIRVIVETVAIYLGNRTPSRRIYNTQAGDKIELGCTGFKNPAGADTIYERKIVHANYLTKEDDL
ncbi:MAG: hypothetical protein JJ895_12000 [Balneolaceae bacterium]|nr:hypothetical protein [Balneolaceae bacterium]